MGIRHLCGNKEYLKNMFILITYDISTISTSGKSRLRKVAKACTNYGQRVQNSVFECKLDPTQCRSLELQLEEIIDTETDSLRFYYLGKSKETKVKHIGAKAAYDIEAPIII